MAPLDRIDGQAKRWARFLRFNGLTAVVSIGGNVALMACWSYVHALLVGMALAVAALSVRQLRLPIGSSSSRSHLCTDSASRQDCSHLNLSIRGAI